MNDQRADASDEHEEGTRLSLATRRAAKARRVRAKLRGKQWARRRVAAMGVAKKAKSTMRKARHRTAVTTYRAVYLAGRAMRKGRYWTAVTIYRALHFAGLWRGDLPGGTGND